MAILPHDIRIGNKLFFNTIHEVTVVSISEDKIEVRVNPGYEIKELCFRFDGIPITKELLEKYGFKEDTLTQYGGYLITADKAEQIRIIYDESYGWHWPMNGYTRPKVNYLHELCNFYYILTGRELGIIENK